MEDWLLKKDDYTPKADKDSFIDKTILGFLSILSLIKRNNKINSSFMYKLNPSVKLIFTIANIIFLSMSKNLMYILIIDVYMLFTLSLLDIEDIKKILALSIVVPIFTSIMLVPSMLMGNVNNSMLIILKVIGTMLGVNVLSYTTKWHDITKALKLFFIPDIFILVFDITLKYIYILGEFSLEMIYALKLRSVGINSNKYSSLSRIMGNLFLKSKDLGDEMYSAMECRGFTGEYVSYSKFSFSLKDFMYAIINVVIIIMYFYFARM
ncbi:energy-coupling factor transporter transmembrane protein EcfT [Clostridium sp. P21]|uniref:Energy-coupling factor transporter transmembrane protein EcfT n=1 Tax=Clostridium muellerianum TaxID=2716538 RepID=A0A7Y0EJJ0_9CLOT|nr:energy-coupling factor transporter transmembrane component T [Clostridium muellerianum]NMM64644.1 energy-coupling factor transporter transmembrane protein EcfT [Clostridium muellerianum]